MFSPWSTLEFWENWLESAEFVNRGSHATISRMLEIFESRCIMRVAQLLWCSKIKESFICARFRVGALRIFFFFNFHFCWWSEKERVSKRNNFLMPYQTCMLWNQLWFLKDSRICMAFFAERLSLLFFQVGVLFAIRGC